MGNFIDRTGEVNKANNGLMMKIIACRSADDIDIEFEDGFVVYHKNYANFKKGSIRHPNVKNPNLIEAGLRTTNLKRKTRKKEYARNKYIGMTKQMNNGMVAKIIEYVDWYNISVQFEDGTIVNKRTMYSFLSGQIGNPNHTVPHVHSKDVGVIKVSKCGFKVKLIEYIDSQTKCKVLFEDGVLKEMWYYAFVQGKIIHPGFSNSRGYCHSDKYLSFTNLKESFNSNGKVFYFCKDKDGSGNLLTPQQMMEKSGIKAVF